MPSSDSFIIPDMSSSERDEIDSLPSDSDLDSEDYEAQQEWERSMQQLQSLLAMVIIPYAGKYFGRQFAFWGKCSRLQKGVNLEADDVEQAGGDTWSGRTMLISSGRVSGNSGRLVQWRPRHYNLASSKAMLPT